MYIVYEWAWLYTYSAKYQGKQKITNKQKTHQYIDKFNANERKTKKKRKYFVSDITLREYDF